MLYELVLLIGVMMGAFLIPNMLLGLLAAVTLSGKVLIGQVVALMAAYFLYFWRHSGQTLAMKTWKIRLTATDGNRPGWPQLALRFALAWPSILTTAGLVWAVFDRDRQFLHDRLAGTRIAYIG